jgi:glycosyltransferase involved in cell wall biosynthesis
MGKKVSVIVTCYNLEEYISRAISSCLNQTLNEESYEIIIIDDCSTDKSWKIIQACENMKNPDIISIRHKTNKGVAAASNTGIKQATGDYIIRVDGDDFINKNMLFVMKEILENNDDIGFVYCDHTVVEKDCPRRMRMNTLERLLDHGAGVMFRAKYIKAIGGYDETLRNREDYDLILRYIKNFDGYHLKLPYYRYFKRDGSLSTQIQEREELKQQIDSRIENE